MPTENRSSNTEQMFSVPEGYMLVERSIWTEQQVEAATACITLLKVVPGMRDRDLAMAAIDAAQCKAPDIRLSDLLTAAQPLGWVYEGGQEFTSDPDRAHDLRAEGIDLTAVYGLAQHQGEPVALPARKDTTQHWAEPGGVHKAEGWNAYHEELARLGPLYTHPAPFQQGEPVAFYREFVDGREYCEKPFTNDWTPLYTHAAAAGEVEQGYHNSVVEGLVSRQNELREERDTLRAEVDQFKLANARLSKENVDRRNQLAEREAALDALNEIATGYKRDLDERDALLRDINKRHSSGVDFDLPADLAARVTALSASAEPSAPKCEDCSGTGSPGGRMHANGIDAPEYEPYKCEKCDGFGIVGNILNAETCTDCTPSAPVERDELVPAALMLRQAGFGNLADAVDEARAALERKP